MARLKVEHTIGAAIIVFIVLTVIFRAPHQTLPGGRRFGGGVQLAASSTPISFGGGVQLAASSTSFGGGVQLAASSTPTSLLVFRSPPPPVQREGAAAAEVTEITKPSSLTRLLGHLSFWVMVGLIIYMAVVLLMTLVHLPDNLILWERFLSRLVESYQTSDLRILRLIRHYMHALRVAGFVMIFVILTVQFMWPLLTHFGHTRSWSPHLEEVEGLVKLLEDLSKEKMHELSVALAFQKNETVALRSQLHGLYRNMATLTAALRKSNQMVVNAGGKGYKLEQKPQ